MIKMRSQIYIFVVICAFVFAQQITWDVIILVFPQLMDVYPVYQIFSAYIYIYAGVMYTRDIEVLKNNMENIPWLKRIIENVLKGSALIIEYIIRLSIIIPSLFSPSEMSNELLDQMKEAKERASFDDKEPLQVRFLWPAGVISIITILVCKCAGNDFLIIYSKIMNTAVSFLGLYFIIHNIRSYNRNDECT